MTDVTPFRFSGIDCLTYRGNDIESHLGGSDGYRGYVWDLLEQSPAAMRAPFPGPYSIDICPVESAIRLTVGAKYSQPLAIDLPISEWKNPIIARIRLKERYNATVIYGTEDELDNLQGERRAGHEALAGRLRDELRLYGVELKPQASMDLADIIAESCFELMGQARAPKGPQQAGR